MDSRQQLWPEPNVHFEKQILVMFHRVITACLILTAAIGPGLCCCSLKAFASFPSAEGTQSADAEHCCCKNRCPSDRTSSPQPRAPHECPCQGETSLAMTASPLMAGLKSIDNVHLDWSVDSVVPLVRPWIVESDGTAFDQSLYSVFLNGRVMLRAHCRMRC